MELGACRLRLILNDSLKSFGRQVRWESSTSILLLKNLESIGSKGDVVSVKRSFAGNFLIPKKYAGMAIILTSGVL
jgi:hypothetical protein